MRLCPTSSPREAEDETPSVANAPELYRPTVEFLNDYFIMSPPAPAPARTHAVAATAASASEGEGDDEATGSASGARAITPMPAGGGGHCVQLSDLDFLDIERQQQKGNSVELYNDDGTAIAVGDGSDPTSQEVANGNVSESDTVTESTSLARIFLLLCRLAGPVTLSQLLRGSMGFISTIFMGQYLTTNLFASATTGLAFTNLTALSIGSGFCAALDTLATQEHGRRKHSPEIAAILMRSLLCTFVVYAPMAALYTFSEPVLALIIHEDLVRDTAFLLRLSVFIIVPMLFTNNLLKFAQSQRVTQMSVLSTAASAVSLPILLYMFGRSGTLGGIIFAMSVSRVIELAVVLYCVAAHANLRSCFQGRTALQHLSAVVTNTAALKHFICVGLPVLAGFCADSWSFEVLSIICAHISPMCSALWGVAMSLYNVLFALGYGIASAGAIRVGNAIGARKGTVARKYSIAVLILAVLSAIPCALVIGLCGAPLYAMMQSSSEVTERGAAASPVIATSFFFDILFYCLGGSFRGIGANDIQLYIICLAMWGLTVPLGFLLGVVLEYDFEGVVVSLGVGVASAVPLELIYLYLYLMFDWQKHQAQSEKDAVEGSAPDEIEGAA